MNITYNAALTECAITSLCDYIESNPTGIFNIHTNAAGCLSIPEVEQACMAAGIDYFEASNFSLYPNPNNGLFEVEFKRDISFEAYELIDITGKVMFGEKLTDQNGPIRLDTHLAPGTYYFRMLGNENIINSKLIIQ